MNFDRVASQYGWLETMVFGRQLQQARVAFLREIEPPRRVLIVGEGNGHFLADLFQAYPGPQVDCIEASARMIEMSRRAVGAAPVTFVQADVRTVALSKKSYDLVVTHFLLDCFPEETLAPLIGQLADAATAEARWLIADFCLPPGGWRRWRARALIAAMYFFFRIVAGIEARHLVDYRPLLRAHDFECTDEMILPNEMIRSELWQRT